MRLFASFCLLPIFYVSVFAQEGQKNLSESPLHHEWVNIPSGDREVKAFVAYPESSHNTPAVIVIHENRGLTDWVRTVVDKLASEGYLAIAPDLLSDYNNEYKSTRDFPDSDAAREALYTLKNEQVMDDLKAVYAYINEIPASNKEVFVMGFCWGGSKTWEFAAVNPEIKAAIVFYGTAPEDLAKISKIEAPVYAFYGANDQRVNATIEKTEDLMDQAGNSYSYVVYPEAGHAFMRQTDSEGASEEEKKAAEYAWNRVLDILE